MYKYVCHVTVYFKKELHRIHRKTCLMDLSIGLRLPVLDINRFVYRELSFVYREMSFVYCELSFVYRKLSLGIAN